MANDELLTRLEKLQPDILRTVFSRMVSAHAKDSPVLSSGVFSRTHIPTCLSNF